MAIRPAREDDFAAIAAITNHYIATTSIHFGHEPVAEAELIGHWRGRFPWLVTEEAGQVVGYAKAGTWRERAAYHWTCETGIYLAPEARGRGLGKPLYVALLAELTTRGFHSVVAGITLPNDASVAMHEALGFASAGVVREAGWKMGAWHAVGFWQLVLSSSAASSPPAATR